MISPIFKENKLLKPDDISYKHSSIYVEFKIDEFINVGGVKSNNDILEYLKQLYDEDILNVTKIKKYLKENYIYFKSKYDIDTKKKIKFEEIYKFSDKISDDDINSFYKLLKKNILLDVNYSKFDLILSIVNIHKRFNKCSNDFYLSSLYYLLNNYDSIYFEFEDKIKNINKIFYSLSLSEFIDNMEFYEILIMNDITCLGDLISLSIEKLIFLNIVDLDKFILNISVFDLRKSIFFSGDKEKIYSNMTKMERDIFKKRFNFLVSEKVYTLNEIAKIYGVTRERIRQKESKVVSKLEKKSSDYNFLIMCLYKKLKIINKSYFSQNILQKYFDDDNITNMLIFYINCKLTTIRFSSNYNCIYDSNLIREEEIIKEETKILGNIIDMNNVDKNDQFHTSIFNMEYKNYKDKIYLKKGLNFSELYMEIIRSDFPNGFRPSNNSDYQKLKELFLERYFNMDETEYPSCHSLISTLERNGLILIDRGTYLPKEMCPTLNIDLFDKIIYFITENAPIVYYRTIYDKFKKVLNKNGVNNHYMLKGLVDPYLTDELHSKRDYISIGDKDMTAYNAVINFIKSYEKEFTLDDLKMKFPGVEEYVFISYLYPETENGLINISNKCFIYYDKLNINNVDREKIKIMIDELFLKLNSNAITIVKLYSKIRLTNNELYNTLLLNYGSYYLFSLLKYIFKNDYFYNRPLICKEKDDFISTYQLIQNYAMSLESFTHKDIKNYIDRMNLGALYSYLNFMEDLSDNYVQTDIDIMIRKELFDIDNFKIEKIRNSLNMILNNFGEIKTYAFKAYQLFPLLKYEWNKYLLVGIIRTYLNNEFIIENTDTKYTYTDYIIRSDKNE